MVSTILYNRSEIKENLAILFKYIEQEDYGMAKNASDNLLSSLLRYYKTRGISANHFYDLFNDLNYELLYCSPGKFKKQLVLDELEKIIKEIKTSTKDPVARLKETYDDIRHLFYEINKQNIGEIVDCFDELEALKPEMERIGGTIYNYYTAMMQKVGDCESTMLRIKQTSPSDSLFSHLEEKFSEFFQAAHKVTAPPITIQITPSAIYEKTQAGVQIEDISEAVGQSEEELRAMLQGEELKRQQEAMEIE
jgi:hypothetical protein